MAVVQAGYFDGVAKPIFIAEVHPARCEYCGVCFSACNVRAIGLEKNQVYHNKSERVSSVKKNICLGCGACVSACEKEAISLIPRSDYIIPVGNKRDLFKTILKEKGRLRPFIINKIKKKAKYIFAMN